MLSLLPQTINAQDKTSLPNILLILADDLGYHDVSYYGTKDIRTPNIDALCGEGLHFDRCYATTVCSPTRASLLSGRYSEMVGVPGLIRSHPEDNFGYLKPGTLLLPQLLKGASYSTALIGKWNLGLESPNTPNEKGFDYFRGFLDDMMDDYKTHLRYGKNYLRENDKEVNPTGHATDIFTAWAIDYINQQKNDKNPFFLYLAYNAPHFPVQPPTDWLEKVKKREPAVSDKRAKLVALIEHMDDGIGKVVQALKATGQYNNTLIIFLSDNGGHIEDGANNGPLRDGKQSMYEGGLRVPAVWCWPGHIKSKTQSAQAIHVIDFLPTLADIAGQKVLSKVDGISFLPILQQTDATLPARDLYFMRREGNMTYAGQTIQAVISGKYKLLQNSPFAPYELYNIQDDSAEQRNIINTEPEVHKRLQQLLIRQIQKGGSVPWQRPESE